MWVKTNYKSIIMKHWDLRVAPVLIKLMLHLFLDYLKQDLGFYSDFCFLILTPIFLGMIMIDYCFFFHLFCL
jgi:hypothetical protein